jgi:hypothetical protein
VALISIYVDDDKYARILDAVASYHRWDAQYASKEEFLNLVVRGFLQQSVKAFDVSEARRVAEEAALALPDVPLENAEVYQPYYYFMICTAATRSRFNFMANNLMPGSSFDVPLTNSPTTGDVTHYALEGAFTEFQRQQLATLEATGAVGAGPLILLYYVRCDIDRIPKASNSSDIVLSTSAFSLNDMANALGLVIL